MINLLSIWIPFLPPSSNKIYEPVYVQGKPRGKRLSEAGRRFKIRAMKELQSTGHAALLNLPEDVPYALTLAVFLEKIENKGWATGNAGNRYTKVDVTNRIKLIEDTIADALGVDDRHNFRISLEKHCDPDNTGIYVSITRVPEEEVGLTKNEYEARLRKPKPHRIRSTGSAEWFAIAAPRHKQGSTNRTVRREAAAGRRAG